jgi:hypothetical protein
VSGAELNDIMPPYAYYWEDEKTKEQAMEERKKKVKEIA